MKTKQQIVSAIQKLTPECGDVIIFKVPESRQGQRAMDLLKSCSEHFDGGVLFLVVPTEWTLVEMKGAVKEEMAEVKQLHLEELRKRKVTESVS